MILREATSDDISGLFEIWTTCFTDDFSYIDTYFKYCFPHTRSLVATTDSGEIASSITLIPATAQVNNETIKGYYLYAVGTKPKHRGFSLSSLLINTAKQICHDENYSFLITRPASDSLYDLYRKLGFSQTLYEDQRIEINNSIENALTTDANHLSPLSLDNFEKFRNTPGNKFIWSREILNYVLLETAEREGFSMFMEEPRDFSKSRYFIAYPEPDNPETILVLENNYNESQYVSLYKLISNLYPQATGIKIVNPNSSSTISQNLIKNGLLLPIRKGCDIILQEFSIMLPLE